MITARLIFISNDSDWFGQHKTYLNYALKS